MPSSKNPKVQIVDQDGDHVADTDGRLKVDIAGATISTGDIDVNLDAGTDNVLVKGSDDGGTTKRVIKTDADGNVQVDIVSGGGGGTQYTEDEVDSSMTGTATMFRDMTDSDKIKPVSNATPLPTHPTNIIASSLQVMATQSSTLRQISGTVEVVQDTPADLTATVTQAGNVTVVQDSTARTVNQALSSALHATTHHCITGMGSFSKTIATAGTPENLADASIPNVIRKVDIQALATNAKLVAIGGSAVSAVAGGTGISLRRGDIYSLEIDSLSDVYLDVLADGEGVRFTYYYIA